MKNIRKKHSFTDIGNDARRQYIDTQSVFSAWEEALLDAAGVRGGMYWKRQGKGEYLIRTAVNNAQKSLGARSPETQAIHAKFTRRKAQAQRRVSELQAQLVRQQRMNRALHVGRAPQLLVDILAEVARSGVADHFSVIGTHALYAYESAAGVRIESPDALATRDVDLLWDTRKRIRFITQMKVLGTSMLDLLRKADSTFKLRRNQRYTAVNSKGFEVDIIRPLAAGDPHPMRMTDDEADFWAVYARRVDVLLDAPAFSSLIISPSGHMARMRTVAPATFIAFKRWMAKQADRDGLKAPRDALQADLVAALMAQYLPQLVTPR